MARLKFAHVLALVAVAAAPALATQFWSAAELARPPGPPVPPRLGFGFAAPSYDADEVFAKGCAFIANWQVTDPNDPNYGGIIEGENAPNIVQTDNTEESVWVWSRLLELTGDDTYAAATARSWIYILNNPAWEEEGWGNPATQYYRIYVSAWGMRAEMMYRQATGDTSHQDYGLTCAQFVADNPIDIDNYLTNGLCTAWAVGNLYAYAEDVGDDSLKAKAVTMAANIKTWAEEAPGWRIGSYSWAMSGGATIWALHESYFREHPAEEASWMAQYGPYLQDLVPPGGNSWDNAWNAWFMLGHHTVYHAAADEAYWTKFANVAANLVAQDTDDDGGIPPSQAGTEDGDHTWVTSYLCLMGMDRIIRDLSVRDLASAWAPGEITLSWDKVYEYGARGYNVYRETVGVPGRPQINDAPVGGSGPYSFVDNDISPGNRYHYWLEAQSPSGHTRLSGPLDAGTKPALAYLSLGQNYPNPASGYTTIPFSLAWGGAAVTVQLFDLAGREVFSREGVYFGAGKRLARVNTAALAPGVYVYRVTAELTNAGGAYENSSTPGPRVEAAKLMVVTK